VSATAERSRVPLPRGAEPPFEVWVNGVRQEDGSDYDVDGDSLVFRRCLAKEGKLGFWRWLSIFLGLVGTYRQDDSVDVTYRRGGTEQVATGLDIHPADSAEGRGPA